MKALFFVNWLIAWAGFTYALYVLAQARRIGWAQWRAMGWRRALLSMGWRLGYALLGGGCASILLGPLYGYVRPPAGEVFFNAGAVMVMVARWLGRRHASSSDR